MKQSIDEIIGDDSWKSEINIPGRAFAPPCENPETVWKLEPLQALRLLPSIAEDTNRKSIRGVSSSHGELAKRKESVFWSRGGEKGRY